MVAALVAKSLLRRDAELGGEPRFGMLETLREYALEQLDASGETAATRAAHAAYYLALAERADPELWGPQQAAWMDRLEADHDNLRAALAWSLAQPDTGNGAEIAMRLGGSLWRFWDRRGHLREGRDWLERALTKPDSVAPEVRVRACLYLGHVVGLLGDYDRARELYETSLEICQEQNEPGGIAVSLTALGLIAAHQGDYARAHQLYEECLPLYRTFGAIHNVAITLVHRGDLSQDEGDFDGARALYDEAMAIYRELGDKSGIALSYCNLGRVARHTRRTDQARTSLEQGLALFREAGDKPGAGQALEELGRVADQQGNAQQAVALFQEALTLRRELGDRQGIVRCLEGLAATVARHGQPEHAIQLAAAAAAWRETVGARLSPADQVDLDDDLSGARKTLRDAAYAAAWTAGRAMPIEQAAAAALELAVAPADGTAATPVSDRTTHAGLTRREVEVLRLVAEGRRNREIADAIFVSHRTVTTHVTSILTKLGVTTRTAAAAYAVAHGLA